MVSANKKITLVAILLVVAASAVIAYSTFINYAPHMFTTNECLECHFTIPQAGDEGPMRFTKPISVLCGRCHKDLNVLSHVVDVVPSMNMPAGMPLDNLGMMTCATCHDPHRNGIDPSTGKKTYYLRTDMQGKRFCLLCHEDPMHPGMVSIFTPLGAVTHRRSMDRSHGFATFNSLEDSVKLDPVSLMCIKCHEADEREADTEKLAQGIWTHGGGIGLSHPIGTDYESAAWKNRELVHVTDLDERIKLFDGKIGCCTCHDPYGKGGGAGLVIGEKNSYQDLCLGCHKL